MPWMELSLNTTPEAVDWIRTLLARTDYLSEVRVIAYGEADQQNLEEGSKEGNAIQPDWAFTICLYLPYDVRVRSRVEEIANLLSPLHRTGLTTALQTTVVEEPGSVALLSPPIHRIGQRFVVLAPDVPYLVETADEITLKLNSSLAFGSGLHPATVVTLRLLERHIFPGMNVLDLGSGSGILSVAMAKLGAKVLALDNDRTAVQSTQDAVRCNAVEQQVTVMQGSLGSGSDLGHWMGGGTVSSVSTVKTSPTFDLIVTNILARVHIALADDYSRSLRQSDEYSGLLITAGFTTDQENEVDKALVQAGFEAVDCERSHKWVALAHVLRDLTK